MAGKLLIPRDHARTCTPVRRRGGGRSRGSGSPRPPRPCCVPRAVPGRLRIRAVPGLPTAPNIKTKLGLTGSGYGNFTECLTDVGGGVCSVKMECSFEDGEGTIEVITLVGDFYSFTFAFIII